MIPPRIGQQCAGGTFTGLNRISDYIYSIIVAPKSTEVELTYKTSRVKTPNTQSTFDGWANTTAMNDVDHPAAHYTKNLVVDGIVDWYLPSKNELELCYRNLKPTCYIDYESLANGTNLSSVPVGIPYTETVPKQTIVTQYRYKSSEAFNSWYWTSTESSSSTTASLVQGFSNGAQGWNGKTNTCKVRGVRRELIAQKQEKH